MARNLHVIRFASRSCVETFMVILTKWRVFNGFAEKGRWVGKIQKKSSSGETPRGWSTYFADDCCMQIDAKISNSTMAYRLLGYSLKNWKGPNFRKKYEYLYFLRPKQIFYSFGNEKNITILLRKMIHNFLKSIFKRWYYEKKVLTKSFPWIFFFFKLLSNLHFIFYIVRSIYLSQTVNITFYGIHNFSSSPHKNNKSLATSLSREIEKFSEWDGEGVKQSDMNWNKFILNVISPTNVELFLFFYPDFFQYMNPSDTIACIHKFWLLRHIDTWGNIHGWLVAQRFSLIPFTIPA